MGEKFGENVNISIWQIKFGENVKILIIVVELYDVWQIKFGDLVKFAKFAKLFFRQTFVLYGICVFHKSHTYLIIGTERSELMNFPLKP